MEINLQQLWDIYWELLNLREKYEEQNQEPSFLEYIKNNSHIDTNCEEFVGAINWINEDERLFNQEIADDQKD